MDRILMTRGEYENNMEKLKALKDKLPGASEMMKEARSHGDLSENSEFDAAKAYLQQLEESIAILESEINSAEIINEADRTTEAVKVGHKVKVRDMDTKKESEYIIVGKTESDPFAKPAKISNEAPIGAALLGKGVGDRVEIFAPAGSKHLKIVSITKRDD